METARTLLALAAAKAITDHHSLRRNVAYLPRSILESLLTSSIKQKKILALRELLIQWPFKQLILKDCGEGFEELHAVLFAFTLQKSSNKLEVIDIRGCRTGFHGTSAFCKLAVGLPVSQNDVSEMTVIDSRSMVKMEQSQENLIARVPPLTVILDCYVNMDNFQLMKQALVKHSILDIKACKMSFVELGKRNICSLVSFLEPDIITSMDVSMNSLEGDGIISLSAHLKNYRNLTELNLGYNRLTHSNKEAIRALADALEHLPHLQKLSLTENNLGNEVVTLLRSIRSPLTQLVVNGCGIRTDELNSLCNIEMLHHLEHLELSTNALVNCLPAMSRFVRKSAETLRHLSIEDNMFVTSSVDKLCAMAKKLQILSVLSICYNHLVPDDVRTIQNAIPDVEVINRDWLF